MKKGVILSLTERREAQGRKKPAPPGAQNGQPTDPDQLWQLLDRNLSIRLWREKVE
ncbi:hypothetical protein LPW11_05540 [Geomonas sp. RF6]|uniref:hypothetical protein n=1 Tax=Geomonas sp. RF6 TaxID=2897342 RepID=UPI001E481736|nr:hypothetical protein [Geomonas sp. RF6]UFS71656.1 hypothetical protein LPW11_05540 [Geomonas sp. RF6]